MKVCKATIVFSDDHGDNDTTFHCQLERGHTGPHLEHGVGICKPVRYKLTWEE